MGEAPELSAQPGSTVSRGQRFHTLIAATDGGETALSVLRRDVQLLFSGELVHEGAGK
jgi:hypothetical protein